MKQYTYDEVMVTSTEYFKGDDLAASTWVNKYCLRDGDVYYERTPDDMHRRMAKEFGRVEDDYMNNEMVCLSQTDRASKYGSLSHYGKVRKNLTEGAIYDLFKDFKYTIPQGSVMSQLGANSIGSLSNCVVVPSPVDSYGGIFTVDEQMAQLFKRRCGVGVDISTLRPSGSGTSNVARTSTGAVSFMHRFSNTTREVAQSGRRGALMLTMDVRHPDIMEFIKIKRDLNNVTGANISIRLNDEFMKAVEEDGDYILRFPCDERIDGIFENGFTGYNKLERVSGFDTYYKVIRAKEYWEEIIKSAHGTAEPCLMNWDAMLDSPDGVYDQFKPESTNPCSEIAMQGGDSCRLIAINLFSFVKNPFSQEAEFDFKKFYEVAYESQRLMDDLVDLELEHVDRILSKIESDPESWSIKQREYDIWKLLRKNGEKGRRTGLGFTALADMLAALGLKYDSDEAISFVNQLMKKKMEAEFDSSIDMAILRGRFVGFDDKIEYPMGYSDYNLEYRDFSNKFYKDFFKNFPEQWKRMVKHGRRNVSISTVAPTGSLSMLAQVSSGIEPVYQAYYTRRKKINPSDEGVRVDFVDDSGDSWQEFPVLHHKFKEWIENTYDVDSTMLSKVELDKCLKASPWHEATATVIDWHKRIEMQATVQKYVTHSISSTINLPKDVSEEVVSDIYMNAWKHGLKGVTVYRDGSRSGVLVTEESKVNDKFDYSDASVKRPREVKASAHCVTSGGEKFSVFVGLMDGRPYEVFAHHGSTKGGEGLLVKDKDNGTKKYYFVGNEDNSRNRIITGKMTPEQETITKLISGSLQHGRDIKWIVKDLTKNSKDITSFNSAIARVLKGYIPDGTDTGNACSECGGQIVYEEGCFICKSCGNTKCG